MLPEPGRSIASLIDITSLKETEKHLREREALYSAMLEGYEGLLYSVSKDLRLLVGLVAVYFFGCICRFRPVKRFRAHPVTRLPFWEGPARHNSPRPSCHMFEAGDPRCFFA